MSTEEFNSLAAARRSLSPAGGGTIPIPVPAIRIFLKGIVFRLFDLGVIDIDAGIVFGRTRIPAGERFSARGKHDR